MKVRIKQPNPTKNNFSIFSEILMKPVSDGWLLKLFTNYIASVGKDLINLEPYWTVSSSTINITVSPQVHKNIL